MKLTWIRQCLKFPTKRIEEGSTIVEKSSSRDHLHSSDNTQDSPALPPDSRQEQLLLHAPKQEYVLVKDGPIPQLQDDREMLIEVKVVGLNPIDWKGP